MRKEEREFLEDWEAGVQMFQHRVECVIHGAGCLVEALTDLNKYLQNQQGVHWKELGNRIKSAERNMARAKRWLSKAKRPILSIDSRRNKRM